MSNKRKKYSPTSKAKVALTALKNEQTTKPVSTEFWSPSHDDLRLETCLA